MKNATSPLTISQQWAGGSPWRKTTAPFGASMKEAIRGSSAKTSGSRLLKKLLRCSKAKARSSSSVVIASRSSSCTMVASCLASLSLSVELRRCWTGTVSKLRTIGTAPALAQALPGCLEPLRDSRNLGGDNVQVPRALEKFIEPVLRDPVSTSWSCSFLVPLFPGRVVASEEQGRKDCNTGAFLRRKQSCGVVAGNSWDFFCTSTNRH
mmetsp:Transcript_56536/g.132643  ORF Transcript_56536/g.132643 Transcript_56536/m.132643 type:complete len:209 (-) Transcript_56536:94-720(-)